MRRTLGILLIFILFGAGIWWYREGKISPPISGQAVRKPQLPGFTVLLVGLDKRPHDPTPRSDSIIAVRVDPEKKQIGALSIPRDTRVLQPDGVMGRINRVYFKWKIDGLLLAVNHLLGTAIERYIITDIAGLAQVVDALGGVTIYVEKDMYWRDDLGEINLKKGWHRLNGQQAAGYARFRHDPQADIGRTRRQQKLLQAIWQEARKPQNLGRLPQVWLKINQAVTSNLSWQEKSQLAEAFLTIEGYQVKTATLPGRPAYIGGASYWLVERAAVEKSVKEILGR
ncbi:MULTISPECIES: LCP family protein [unclassified Carboxydocella]|uniref:LCP family protein n=1 Tax=unclassified Carboxydocella TaxID=2685367 RepID=UPI0009AEFB4C|nr:MULTISPECIES: LCP family protein [unclassified Carboxydocella]GAW28673.1 transcriptional regulator [Carboxydocella sp. ULO1]GAW30518.1 transcriptional regulator [Carboxydocella sp. JDF658]